MPIYFILMQNDKEKKVKAKPKLPSRGVKRNLEEDIDWNPTSITKKRRQDGFKIEMHD